MSDEAFCQGNLRLLVVDAEYDDGQYYGASRSEPGWLVAAGAWDEFGRLCNEFALDNGYNGWLAFKPGPLADGPSVGDTGSAGQCGADTPPMPAMGYLCTEPKGHPGSHRCEYAEWPNRTWSGDDVRAGDTGSVVTFEFESRAVAEAFGDAVMDWLCEVVPAPPEMREQAAREITPQLPGAEIGCPRAWLYEDASPSIGPLARSARPGDVSANEAMEFAFVTLRTLSPLFTGAECLDCGYVGGNHKSDGSCRGEYVRDAIKKLEAARASARSARPGDDQSVRAALDEAVRYIAWIDNCECEYEGEKATGYTCDKHHLLRRLTAVLNPPASQS